jgi:hypothetical protein
MKLTLTQKALRPVLKFLTERYFPSGAFYGREYLKPFAEMDAKGNGISGGSAAMYLQSVIRKAKLDGARFDMREVTYNGTPVGSWRLSLDRIDGEGSK